MLGQHTYCHKRIICNSVLLLSVWFAVLWVLCGLRYSNLNGTAQYQEIQRTARYSFILKTNLP